MTRTLWLHCGSFKSGSSRIQNLAWNRRGELLAAGWLYPATGLVTDEPDVGVRHSDLVYLHREPDTWQQLVDDLVAEIDASPASQVLMSSEAWSRPGKGEVLAELLTRLRAAGVVDDVQAVLYLRNRFGYARSFYRELTRRRDNVLSLAEFVDATPRPLDSLDTVRTLRASVAPGRLSVYAYDELADTGSHFYGLLGVPVPAEETRENLGIDPLEIEAHRQLNLVAPQLRDQWPGLDSVMPPEVSLTDGDWSERFAEGQLTADDSWRASFTEETGWSASSVAALLEPPDRTGRDVTEMAGLLSGVVQAWLEREFTPRAEVTTYPHPTVSELVLDEPDASATIFRVGGVLLPSPTLADGWRLLAICGSSELIARLGRPSPAFGRRHPDRPEAAVARFGIPHCGFARHGRIDLVLELPSGERAMLATLRRGYVRRDRRTSR